MTDHQGDYRSPFEQACADRGLAGPTVFPAQFARAASLIGESVTVTDRQLRRWRGPNPPAPPGLVSRPPCFVRNRSG